MKLIQKNLTQARTILILLWCTINPCLAVDISTGWIHPDSLASPVSGDYTQGVVAAIGSEASFDNVRLNALVVYDYYSNTTFGTYLGGTTDDDAGIYVISYNHSTQKPTEARNIYRFSDIEGSGYDGHSYPTIVKSLDGHIHVFFCDQSGGHNNIQIRFNERGSVESDYTTTILNNSGQGIMGRAGDATIRAEYPKPFVSRNGTMYFFSRYVPYSSNELELVYNEESYRAALRPQVFVKSEDHGLSWDSVRIAIMRTDTIHYLTEPYLTQTLAEPMRDGVEERIHFSWTLAAGIGLWFDGDGLLQHNYHNAHSKNVYHAYFVPGEDTYYAVDGTNLGKSIRDEEMDNHCLVIQTPVAQYPLPMTTEQWAETRSENESIMGHYTVVDDQGNTVVDRSKRWNGSAWEDIEMNVSSDTRIMDWRNGRYYAYNGVNNYFTSDLESSWTTLGAFDLSTSEVSDRMSTLGMKKSCPPAGSSHPEALVWAKMYRNTGERYGSFVFLGGHRTSYIPAKVIVEVEQGTASPGDVVPFNAYIVDENGARITTANHEISFNTSVGTFSNTTTTANQGLGKTALTIGGGLTTGEYKVTATVNGLALGFTYLTIKADDAIAPSTPTGLSGIAVSSSQIDLSWAPATDNLAVSGYRIFRDGIDLASTSDTTYSSINLNGATTYNYSVLAYDANGNESERSEAIMISTPEDATDPLAVLNGNQYAYSAKVYPNPFTNELQITYTLPEAAYLDMSIYSMQGNLVKVLENSFKTAGKHSLVFHPSNMSKGAYYIILHSKQHHEIQKILYY